MFALFLSASVSAEAHLEIVKPGHKDACFDLKYFTGDYKEWDTTHNNDGVFAAYRVHNENGTYGPLRLVRWRNNKKSTYKGLEVVFYTEFFNDTDFTLIKFNVTNNGYFPKKFDLGVSSDVDFATDDNAMLSLREDGRGFQMYAGKKYLTVFTNSVGEFPDVDTVFLGALSDSETSDPYKLPYFENDNTTKSKVDTVYSYSWLNREILPGETIVLGVTMRYYNKIKTPPRIFDLTSKKEFYGKNEEVNITFHVKDEDANEYKTIFIEYNGGNETLKTRKKDETFVQTVMLGEGPVFEYTINATDSKGYQSNVVKGRFIISQPPTMTVTTEPIGTYEVGQKISVEVEVTSNNSPSIMYQFDNGRIEKSTDKKFDIAIPNPVRPGKSHNLTIYAEDEYGLKSEKKLYSFEYTGELPEEEEAEDDDEEIISDDDEPASNPGTEETKSNPGTEEPKSKPGDEETKSKPGNEETKSNPGNDKPASNPGDGSKGSGQSGAKTGGEKGKDNNKVLIIVLSVVGVVVVICVIAVVAYIFMKKGSNQNIDDNAAPSAVLNNEEAPTDAGLHV